jgi:hypothetical protein
VSLRRWLDAVQGAVADNVLARDQYLPLERRAPGDVMVAGFPKSGNTWMQYLLSSLQYGIDGNLLTDRLANEIVPDVQVRRYYKRLSDVACFKTHHLPRPDYRKVIHLVRDGRDAMLSYHAYIRNRGVDCTLDDMVLQSLHVKPAPWWEHTRQWIANPFGAQILALRYEDLLGNPVDALERVCGFIGWQRSREQIGAAVESNRFERQRKRPAEEVKQGHAEWSARTQQEFFRKGVAGEFRTAMPEHLQRAFEEKAGAELAHFGYERLHAKS